MYSRITISQTSKGNNILFEKSGVLEIKGGIKLATKLLRYCFIGAVMHIMTDLLRAVIKIETSESAKIQLDRKCPVTSRCECNWIQH